MGLKFALDSFSDFTVLLLFLSSFPLMSLIYPLLCKVLDLVTESSSQSFEGSAVSASKSCSSKVPFVYGFIDLFSGCGESWHWGLGIDENRGVVPSVPSHASDGSNYEVMWRKIDKNVKPLMIPDAKQGTALIPSAKLDTVKEENEDDNRSISTTDSSTSPMEEWVENGIKGKNRVSDDCVVLFFFHVHVCN